MKKKKKPTKADIYTGTCNADAIFANKGANGELQTRSEGAALCICSFTWTMTFADDIVIYSESRQQIEEKHERWRFALERIGMKVSCSKTEYMCVNEIVTSGVFRLQGAEVVKVQKFKNLGTTEQRRLWRIECMQDGTAGEESLGGSDL